MTKKLARLLRADIQETSDLKSIAAMLAGKGRGGDTLLAHITPKEVDLLKEAGGAGTVNPDTGLLEFYDWSGGYGTSDPTSSSSAPSYTPTAGDWTGYSPASASQPIIPFDASSVAPTQSYTGSPTGGMAPVEDVYSRFPGEINYQQYGELQPGLNVPFTTTREDSFAPTVIGTPSGAAAEAAQRQALIGKGGTKSAEEKPFLSNEQMVRLGLTGGLGVYGAMQQRKAAEQMKAASGEQKALAAPYQQQGKAMQEAAMRGELTPAAAQQYQALQAQLAQGASQRGGVGVAQAAAQAEAFKNQLLQGQYDYGLKVSSIGDNIALGAIRTGMQLDQQLNQANMAFYTQLGTLAAGVPTYRV
jgi:hypothetical protein